MRVDFELLKECAVNALWWPLLASMVLIPLSQMGKDIQILKEMVKPKKPERIRRTFQMFELKK